MMPARVFPLSLITLFAMAVFSPGPSSTAAENGCMAAQCHATVLSGTRVHPPTESCESCHESVVTPHPQTGKTTFKLVQEPPSLCESCHESFGKKAHVHPPAAEGMCVTCHSPHSSNEPALLAQPMKALCQSCHSDQGTAKHAHGPVSAGDCTACHAPHESDLKLLLLKQDDELCLGCHLDIKGLLTKKTVHPALEGGCTSCHIPHGTDHPKLLSEEGSRLCFQCHDTIKNKIDQAAVGHPPITSEKGCATCHSPHAGDNAKLLVKKEMETCLGCHATIITGAMTVLHGPIKDGSCTACHQPHGSRHPKLLDKAFPVNEYVAYSDTEYQLCFSCHNRDLVKYPDTSFATGFRDGERNLHYLHVNNQKGRSCKLCHEIHGGTNAGLVADSVPFGKWKLPLKFVKTETGGGCSPGCHKMQPYDREVPGRKPVPPAPPSKRN